MIQRLLLILLRREMSVFRLAKADYFAIRQKHDLAIHSKSYLLVSEVVLKRPGLLCLVENAMLGHKLCKSLDLFVFVSKVHDIVQLHNLSVKFLLRVP
jgi:hypothetical protein